MDAYFLPGQQKHIPLIPTLLPLQVGYDGGSYNMVKPQAPWTLKGRALYQVCTPKNLGGHLRILPTTQCCAVLCCAKLLSCVRLFVTPWPVAHQAPLSMGDSSGKNTGVSCHALLQGIFPTQGSNPGLPHCRVDSLLPEPPEKPKNTGVGSLSLLQGIFLTQESNWVSSIEGEFFTS